jgi:iron(III) transport system ATP-binding protein
MATIKLDNISVTYKGTNTGVHNVSLEVEDGEFLALIGPSGSGKTTLLRAIAGLIRPQQGTICIGDNKVSSPDRWVPPERRNLGMVFQQHAIWPHWTVGQNVAYPLKLKHVSSSEIRTRVAAVLTQVGLEGSERRKPSTLSGGQRQRVALARALVMRPAALLLDEALSSLDEPLRDRLRMELKELATEFGLTVVHVTHDRAEALSLADRIVTLKDGHVQQIDKPEVLVVRPLNEFMASFMNDATILTGQLGFDTAGHPVFSPQHGGLPLAVEHIEYEGTTSSAGSLAILPQDVTVETVSSLSTSNGIVKSVLFGRASYDVVLDYHGHDLRVEVKGRRPLVGETLHIAVRRALFFASTGASAVEKAA